MVDSIQLKSFVLSAEEEGLPSRDSEGPVAFWDLCKVAGFSAQKKEEDTVESTYFDYLLLQAVFVSVLDF